MAVRVAQQLQNQLQRQVAGLARPAPALGHDFLYALVLHSLMDRLEYFWNCFFEMNVHLFRYSFQ